MNSIIVFWNSFNYDMSSPEKVFLRISNINKTVNVISDSPLILKNSYCNIFINKEHPSRIKLESNVPYDIRQQLSKHETNIFKVINRNFKGKGRLTTLDSIFSYYENTLTQVHNICVINNITTSVFFDTPHHPFDYIAFLYFKAKGINTFVTKKFPSTHSGVFYSRRFITTNFPLLDHKFDSSYTHYYSKTKKLHLLPDDLKQFVNEYKGDSVIKYNKLHLGSRWSLLYISNYLFRRLLHHLKELSFIEIFKKLYIYFYRLTIDRFLRIKLLRYYEKNTYNPNLNHKYFYFPLQYQPEASTIPLGNEFSDQELALNYILENSSDDVFIYVREHPAFWHRISNTDKITDVRTQTFYKRLINNNRVRLISPNENHLNLIKNSSAVITITGTVAFEAFGANKRVFMFGDYIYSSMANVTKLPSHEAKKLLKTIDYSQEDFSNQFLTTLFAIQDVSTAIKVSNQKTLGISSKLSEEFEFIADYINYFLII